MNNIVIRYIQIIKAVTKTDFFEVVSKRAGEWWKPGKRKFKFYHFRAGEPKVFMSKLSRDCCVKA